MCCFVVLIVALWPSTARSGEWPAWFSFLGFWVLADIAEERTQLGRGVHRDADRSGLLLRDAVVESLPEARSFVSAPQCVRALLISSGVNSSSALPYMGRRYQASAESGQRPRATPMPVRTKR